jgi:hypothetical protein
MNYTNYVKRVIRLAFHWDEVDSYLTPDKTGHAWYLYSLIDTKHGSRESRLEPLPDTWFICPREEDHYICMWYNAG